MGASPTNGSGTLPPVRGSIRRSLPASSTTLSSSLGLFRILPLPPPPPPPPPPSRAREAALAAATTELPGERLAAASAAATATTSARVRVPAARQGNPRATTATSADGSWLRAGSKPPSTAAEVVQGAVGTGAVSTTAGCLFLSLTSPPAGAWSDMATAAAAPTAVVAGATTELAVGGAPSFASSASRPSTAPRPASAPPPPRLPSLTRSSLPALPARDGWVAPISGDGGGGRGDGGLCAREGRRLLASSSQSTSRSPADDGEDAAAAAAAAAVVVVVEGDGTGGSGRGSTPPFLLSPPCLGVLASRSPAFFSRAAVRYARLRETGGGGGGGAKHKERQREEGETEEGQREGVFQVCSPKFSLLWVGQSRRSSGAKCVSRREEQPVNM